MRMYAFLFVVGLLYACSGKHTSDSTESISGTYVREGAFKVTNPETGAEIGMMVIRDSIFVRPAMGKFEVINHKWVKNDYDTEGWRNMLHSNSRPTPTFTSAFDTEGRTLVGSNGVVLHFERDAGIVFWNVNAKYHKVFN